MVEVQRLADLLHVTIAQHNNLVGHGHGFDLVVRYVDHGGLQLCVKLGQFLAHLHPQLGVEVGQRLVEQEDFRVADDGTADGDALALTARHVLGLAVEQLLDLQDPRGAHHALFDLGLGALGQPQAEGHVLEGRQVRVERVGLEHHGDAALGRRHIVHHLITDVKIAGRDVFQTGHHPQQGGLTAARWPDKDSELTVFDIEIDIMDHAG